MLEELVISMRPKQWYKNLVIFVCIVFSMNLLNIEMWFQIVFAFIIFCMLSGSEYIYNDILEFVETLYILHNDKELNRVLGEQGNRYFKENYSWDVIKGKYVRLIDGYLKV